MNRIKHIALVTLGALSMGLMIFSAASIGMMVIGLGAALAFIGFIAKPFLPKSQDETCIIDGTPVSSTPDS